MLACVLATGLALGSCTLRADNVSTGALRLSHTIGEMVHSFHHAGGRRRRAAQWGNQPADEALQWLQFYVKLTETPPEPEYVEVIDGEESIVGKYNSRTNEILLKSGRRPEFERWTALHELFHWAGFGLDKSVGDTAKQIWKSDVGNSGINPQIEDKSSHWKATSLSGTHTRSRLAAKDEAMTAVFDGDAFLSAATFAELQNRIDKTEKNWCVDDADCEGTTRCEAFNSRLPKICGGGAFVPFDMPLPGDGPEPGGLSPGEIAGIVAGSVGGVAVIALGVWWAMQGGSGGAAASENAQLLGAKL